MDEVLLKFIHRKFAAADEDELNGDDAYHFAEETVGCDLETDAVAGAIAVKGGLGYLAKGVLVTIGTGAKGAIIGVIG